MAKKTQRFDYARFGEALVERGLIDREVLSHVLQQCNSGRALLPEILVRENLVSDWEISRVACELYHLPFLTLEQYSPGAGALDGYDVAYLRHYALVPLDRFGALVTVVMPGLVPSEVLEGLNTGTGGKVLPVVGSVTSNRRWLEEQFGPPEGAKASSASAGTRRTIDMSESPAAALPKGDEQTLEFSLDDGDWSNIFDAGEEAVQLDLNVPEDD
jgi:hypothetical protein